MSKAKAQDDSEVHTNEQAVDTIWQAMAQVDLDSCKGTGCWHSNMIYHTRWLWSGTVEDGYWVDQQNWEIRRKNWDAAS